MKEDNIISIEVIIVADGQWYGRWVTEIEGSLATHSTPGFQTQVEALAAIGRLFIKTKN